jgi:putative ABC transport system substrate-binding protein
MRRRDFIAALGLAAAWPLAARAQQPALPVVGFIGVTSLSEWSRFVVAFRQGLSETGFAEGRNVTIEYRWAEGHYERLPEMAADLVRRKVDVLVTIAPPAAKAAIAATSSIPIVFFTGADPVQLGLVASLSRPGGNVTGVTTLSNEVAAKRLEILREVAPQAETIALLINPTNPNAQFDARDVQAAATVVKQPLLIENASSDADIEAVFAGFAKKRIGAMLVNPDPFLLGRRDRIVALAAQQKLPTIFHVREPVAAGGLMSYGASFADGHRQVGVYAGRILKGAKPADLPVPQATKFELAINLKTARALGLAISPTLLVTADEVIE